MKIYKCYFDKKDTPYRKDFQKHRKYHVVWKRRPYSMFLGHKVVMIKKYGIFRYKGDGIDIDTIVDKIVKALEEAIANSEKSEQNKRPN